MAADSAGPKRILVVDDSEEIREFYRTVFESAGYTVESASNGREGLRAVRISRPDLLIVDVSMPVMDGFELLLQLRSDVAPPLPPVILSSGFQITEQEALQRGAYAFLPKPVEVDDLLLLVGEALSNQPPSPQVLERERKHSATAREVAGRAAEAALGSTSTGDLARKLSGALGWGRGYFDVDEVFAAVIRSGRLLAITHREADSKLYADHPLPLSITDIITTGSALVLADAANHPCVASDLEGLRGARSFVGVPVVGPTKVVTGAICLARRRIEPFPAEDVLVLEYLGQRLGQLLHGIEAGQPDPFRGFGMGFDLPAGDPATFEIMVEMELRLALRQHAAIELAIADLAGDFQRGAAKVINGVVEPARMVVFSLSPRRVALLKRGETPEAVSQQIDAAIDVLRRVVRIDSVGSMLVAAAVAGFLDSQTLIHLADRQRSRCAGTGRLERAEFKSDSRSLGLMP